MIEKGVAKTLQRNAIVQEHIGEIESCETSMLALQKSNQTREFTFSLTGSKGNGTAMVIVPEQESSTGEVISFPQSLHTPDGNTYDLTGDRKGGILEQIFGPRD